MSDWAGMKSSSYWFWGYKFDKQFVHFWTITQWISWKQKIFQENILWFQVFRLLTEYDFIWYTCWKRLVYSSKKCLWLVEVRTRRTSRMILWSSAEAVISVFSSFQATLSFFNSSQKKMLSFNTAKIHVKVQDVIAHLVESLHFISHMVKSGMTYLYIAFSTLLQWKSYFLPSWFQVWLSGARDRCS